ncbi:GH3 auxin-responsive promoter family protein [Persicobacter psychrovividus]|uniref:GH3 auxin-responsive promoter n=1 Tax=Persicobacter psychrovividus TaxID=387638 RepID=A0ABM7VG71_9BACT|nr:hypothetical protein PEPS_22390 [Persicobacter psychrovividus]
MGLLSFFSKYVAAYTVRQQNKWASRPIESQYNVFQSLIKGAENTAFGKDHDFENINTYEDFKKRVPIRDYEQLRPYVDRVVAGEADVLWKGRPIYFAKTSGTTSGVKYIPLTKESIPNHINSARNMLLNYMHETGNYDFVSRKLIFLSGSPTLEDKNGVFLGRLSGIVNHHVPEYLRRNQMPSYETNCIEEWEEKLDAIVAETSKEDMSLISGIPPWVQMYFDRLQEKHGGKKIIDIFPNFSVFVWGGVNFEPYRAKLYQSIGKEVDTLETYPASEGFIAYQDTQDQEGLLLNISSGIFFEFIPADQYFDENPERLSIGEVELGVNYAVIINNNAGLWGYSIGDTVKFVSKKPYRVIVSGRIKHFISAFGEHVIGEEVEKAMKAAVNKFPETELTEFTVAPMVSQSEGQSKHEWFVDFENKPKDMDAFSLYLDEQLQQLNVYYKDLVSGNILLPLQIVPLKKNAFQDYMKSIGKLGGQNKVPRLANDRKIADALMDYAEK